MLLWLLALCTVVVGVMYCGCWHYATVVLGIMLLWLLALCTVIVTFIRFISVKVSVKRVGDWCWSN
jgi:hypothetical protein